jgi:4-hydroxy-tetrahydrodipicolinate synthase
MKQEIHGLWVPLLTPFYQGEFDGESMISLLKNIDPFIDGYVPCLNSGEGSQMADELWEEVVTFVIAHTNKPVAVGIFKGTIPEIVQQIEKAKLLGCKAVVIPVQGTDEDEMISFCNEVSSKSSLPVIIYNTEKTSIKTIEGFKKIAGYPNIVAVKDSSGNASLFQELVRSKSSGELDLSLLQGMENQLLESAGADGFLISLANIDPELSKNMLKTPTQEMNAKVMEKWDEYDLASETWFMNLKKILTARGVLKSAEAIR